MTPNINKISLKPNKRLKNLQCKCEEIRKNIKKDVLENRGFSCKYDDVKYKQDLAEACKRLKNLQYKCDGIRKVINKDLLEYRGFGSYGHVTYEQDLAEASELPTLLQRKCNGIRRNANGDVFKDGNGSVAYAGTCEQKSVEPYVDRQRNGSGKYIGDSMIETRRNGNKEAAHVEVGESTDKVSRESAFLDCNGSREYKVNKETRNKVVGEEEDGGKSQPEIEETCKLLKVLNFSSNLNRISETDEDENYQNGFDKQTKGAPGNDFQDGKRGDSIDEMQSVNMQKVHAEIVQKYKMKKKNTRLIKRRVVNGEKRVTWVTNKITKENEVTWLNKTKEMGWEMTEEMEKLLTVCDADKISTGPTGTGKQCINPRTTRGGGWVPPPLAFFPYYFFDDSNWKNCFSVSVTRDRRHILAYVTSS